MKNLIASAAGIAVIAGTLLVPTPSQAQNAPAQSAATHKVGLIDMAHIFKNYKKFEALRNNLQDEVKATDEEAKQRATLVQQKSEGLKQLKAGTEAYTALEAEITKMASEFEAFRKTKQREFLRKEAEIYKQIYLEVTKTVSQYAEAYNYTLVMRFSRDGVAETEGPQEVLQKMNSQVVFYRESDDITNDILNFLNKQYETASAGRTPRPRQ